MEKVQEEAKKLKELYKSSSNVLEKWPKSDVISSCNDKMFVDYLQNLSDEDLEIAVYILQRQLDIEVQRVKCLEYLREMNTESCDISSKLIASQGSVARLRSRLLRTVNKQLNNHGKEGALPPWHSSLLGDRKQQLQQLTSSTGQQESNDSTGDVCARNHLASNNTSVSQEELKDTGNDISRTDNDLDQFCPTSDLSWVEIEGTSPTPIEKEKSTNGNLPGSQSNDDQLMTERNEKINDSTVKVHKVRESMGADEGMKKLQETLEKNLHERAQDTKAVGISKLPPPKPTPYSALERMKMLDTAGGCLDTKEDEIDGVITNEQILMRDWDPTRLLEDLFGEKERALKSQTNPADGSPSLSIVRMSGYMDKLPSSYKQKKSSVFKGWKRRHFKAFDGKLFYFEDHRNKEPLGMVELKGSSVAISAGKILEINDYEGKPVLKLRCSFQFEAEDWKKAIQIEAGHHQDPVYEEMTSPVKSSVIIIDLGSSTVKAGFAKEEAWPEVIFPCVCSVLKENESDCVYGYAALSPKRRIKSNLRFPLRRSLKIDKLKFSTLDLTGIIEHAFHSLNVDPSNHKVVMTIPQNTSQKDKGDMVEILLSFFNVEACYLQEQAILAMYSYSAVSGVIVDVGDHTDVIPVVEGCVIEAGASRLPYGGRQVTDMLARLLTEKGHRFFSEVESYITRYIKEKCCYVSQKEICTEKDIPDNSVDIMLDKYMIPDGTRKVTVDNARYRCTEGLFDPIVWGKDHPGISDLVYKAIMACSIDVRRHMARSIYLSGGGSMLPGFAERLHAEVGAKLPPHTIVQVHAGTDRQHAALIGASVVARLPLFEELCISQSEWNDNGIDALEKWQSI